jgi:hypothetical protein
MTRAPPGLAAALLPLCLSCSPRPAPLAPFAAAAALSAESAGRAGAIGAPYVAVGSDQVVSGSFTAPFEDERLVLRVVELGTDAPHGEEAAAQGFVTTRMRAELILVGAAGTVIARELLEEWEDGWEWGTRWHIAGLLVDADGRAAAALVREESAEGPGIDSRRAEVRAVAVAGAGFAVLWTGDANQVSVQADGDALDLRFEDAISGDENRTRVTLGRIAFAGGAVIAELHSDDDDDETYDDGDEDGGD